MFRTQLRERAVVNDWCALHLIPKDGDELNAKDLFESDGGISYKDDKQHAEGYINTGTRSALDSMMIYLCIMALTEEGMKKVRSRALNHPVVSED